MAAMERSYYLYFSEWAKTEGFLAKKKESIRFMEKMLREHPKAYIAYSGGKDSSAMLHMALGIRRNITVIHWDYGKYYVPRPIEREIISNARKMGATDIRIMTSGAYDRLGRKAVGILGRHFLGIELPKLIKEGYTLAFIGLRAEESVTRRLRTADKIEYDKKGIINAFPLADWSWRDVWAYIVSENVPHLGLYHRYARLLGYDNARFVTLFDPEFDKFGSTNIDKFLEWRYFHEYDR